MIRFNNDYNHGAVSEIIEALAATNNEAYAGYGLDEWCDKAKAEIAKYIDEPDAQIHFFVGGTQVNFTAITSALRPYQSILCADSGHINVHETGAVENTGHKIEALPAVDGKITAEQIDSAAAAYEASPIPEHITQPKLVYISQPTEYGTLYTKAELADISAVCAKHGLFLFVDGARLGYALGSDENDATLSDLASLTDMFTIGGTKCGALFGEALVISDPSLQTDFRSYIKQNGAMLAKGWLLGLQFYTLFKDGLYLRVTERATKLGLKIRDAFHKKGIKSFIESPTNQQFVVVDKAQKAALAKDFIFEEEATLDAEHDVIRFCTGWNTTETEVDALIRAIEAM